MCENPGSRANLGTKNIGGHEPRDCHGTIPGTFIACGEDYNYCSRACVRKALQESRRAYWRAGWRAGLERALAIVRAHALRLDDEYTLKSIEKSIEEEVRRGRR